MGFEDVDIADGSDVAANLSTISCSVCLEAVSDNGDRSGATLCCGHQFHLDCIGSAFNVKGVMQCPNCRKIEKGQWLYANGGRAFPEFNMDDDLFDFSYAEMSFGVHWCPFNGLTRLPTSFNEGEFSTNGYHDLLGQHVISMEHTSVSSGSHPCPYVAYLSPLSPSSSNLAAVSDGSNFSGRWTGNEVPASYALPSMDVHYHSWDHPSPHFSPTSNRSGGLEQSSILPVSQRSSRPSADIPRSVSFMQPLQVGHSSSARAGSTASSSITPPYPGSNARARDRVQALQAYYQRPSTAPSSRTPVGNGSSRRASHRGLTQVVSGPPPSPLLGAFQYMPSSASSSRNYMEAENPMPRGFHAWETEQAPSFQTEREPTWGTSFHHPSAPDAGVRFNGHRQRRASERTSSQNR